MKRKSTQFQRRDMYTGFAFALPAIIGMGVFFILPFMVAIFYSFSEGIGSGTFAGLRNYTEMFSNPAFQLAAGNTARFILVSVPLIMVLSLLIALLLNTKLRGYQAFRTLFILPLVLPVASVVLVFQVLFAGNGVVNDILQAMGIPVSDWLQSPGAFTVLLILYIWKNCGYNIILFLAALNAVPREYYEAAEIDGAGTRTRLFHITLPLIMPYMFFILLISVINTFKSFREAYVLCGSHPNQSIYMMQHFLNNNFQNTNFLRLSTAAILIFLVISAVIFLLFWLKSRAGEVEL